MERSSSGDSPTTSTTVNMDWFRALHKSFKLEEKKANISPGRMKMEAILRSPPFEVAVSCALAFNIVLIVSQTNAHAAGHEPSAWVEYGEYALNVLYVIEMVFRIYVRRWYFLLFPRDVIDAIIVGSNTLYMITILAGFNDIFPSIALLRIFRIVRLGRVVTLLHVFPELWTLMAGLVGAVKVMFWGMLLINIWLVILSIVAVQIIHPINLEIAAEGTYEGCERCPRAFASVGSSMLTFTQTLLAGDSWGQVAVPIIEHTPMTYAYFLLVLTTICIAFINLMLAAIVEAAQQARKIGDQELVRMKEEAYASAEEQFLSLCRELDTDCSGTLGRDELVKGYEENQEFAATMKAMDVTREDMGTVFNILDEDKSGDVDYHEFASQLHKMKSNDSHMMLIFIKHYTKKMHDDILAEFTTSMKDTVGHLQEARSKLDTLESKLDANKTVNHVKGIVATIDAPTPPPAVGSQEAIAESKLSTLPGRPPLAMPAMRTMPAMPKTQCEAPVPPSVPNTRCEAPVPPSVVWSEEAVAESKLSTLPLAPLAMPHTQHTVCQAKTDALRQLGQIIVPPWDYASITQAECKSMHWKLEQLEAIFERARDEARRLMDSRIARCHARIEL